MVSKVVLFSHLCKAPVNLGYLHYKKVTCDKKYTQSVITMKTKKWNYFRKTEINKKHFISFLCQFQNNLNYLSIINMIK